MAVHSSPKAGRMSAFLLCTILVVFSPAARPASITSTSILRPEGVRHYLLARPDQSTAKKHPLIILLHGHTGSAAQLFGEKHSASPFSVWLKIADREGLLVAAPDGAKGKDGKQGWNDCRGDNGSNPKTDDVGLVRAIIAKEVAEHNADPARVYVMGMSNGGMMAFRLASEIGGQLAGFATVSASMAAQSICPAPRVPVSALIVSGTADPLVPYAGGNVHFFSSPHGGVIGVEQSAALWRQTDALPSTPVDVTTFPHLHKKDQTEATRTVWGARTDGLQVELIRIENGGHVEPSISQHFGRIYTMIVGPQNGDLEIADEAWAFFRDKRAGLRP